MGRLHAITTRYNNGQIAKVGDIARFATGIPGRFVVLNVFKTYEVADIHDVYNDVVEVMEVNHRYKAYYYAISLIPAQLTS